MAVKGEEFIPVSFENKENLFFPNVHMILTDATEHVPIVLAFEDKRISFLSSESGNLTRTFFFDEKVAAMCYSACKAYVLLSFAVSPEIAMIPITASPHEDVLWLFDKINDSIFHIGSALPSNDVFAFGNHSLVRFEKNFGFQRSLVYDLQGKVFFNDIFVISPSGRMAVFTIKTENCICVYRFKEDDADVDTPVKIFLKEDIFSLSKIAFSPSEILIYFVKDGKFFTLDRCGGRLRCIFQCATPFPQISDVPTTLEKYILNQNWTFLQVHSLNEMKLVFSLKKNFALSLEEDELLLDAGVVLQHQVFFICKSGRAGFFSL